MVSPNKYPFRGEFWTLNELSDKFGTHPNRIRSRILAGWSVEDAATKPAGTICRKNIIAKLHELNGRKKTLSDWCREYNSEEYLVRSRLRAGWDVLEALTTPPGSHSKTRAARIAERRLIAHDRLVDCLREGGGDITKAAGVMGVSYESFVRRLVAYGVPHSEVVHRRGMSRSREFVLETLKSAGSIKLAAGVLEVSQQRVSQIAKRYGIGKEEYQKPELHDIGGESRTLEDWCSIHRVSVNFVRHRMDRGWGLLEALTKPAFARSDVSEAKLEAYRTAKRDRIIVALRQTQGHRERAAKILGIHTPTIHYLIKKFGVPESEYRDWRRAKSVVPNEAGEDTHGDLSASGSGKAKV